MIFLYITIVAICLAISRTPISLIPFAIIISGYYLYFILAAVIKIGTNATALYWILVDALSYSLLRIKSSAGYICDKKILFLITLLFLLILANAFFVSDMTPFTIKKLGFVILLSYVPFFISLHVNSSDDAELIHAVTILAFAMNVITIIAFARAGISSQRFTFTEDWSPINSAVVSSVGALGSAWIICEMKNKSILKSMFHYFAFALSFIAIFVTSQRGPLLSLIFVFLTIPPFALKIFSLKRFSVGISIFALSIVILIFNPNAGASKRILLLFSSQANLSTVKSSKTTARLRYERYIKSFYRGADKPLTGIGFGNSPERIYAHNSILELFEETGFFGSITFIAILITAFFSIVKRRTYLLSINSHTVSLFWGSVFTFAVLESLVSFSIFEFTLFWLALGMATRVHTFKTNELGTT